MPGLLETLKIKRGTKTKPPQPAGGAEKSLFGRKTPKAPSGQPSDAPAAPKKAGRSLTFRKVNAAKPPIEPKLPDTSGPAPLIYELDGDSLLSGGRRKMAIGLLWQPKSPGQRLHQQAASASVGDSGFDLSVVHADGTQVGFASKMDAHKAGMVAAATAIPRQFTGDTWLGAFVLPIAGEQMQLAWWIVAHRDGQVYEDRLIRNEIEARESFIDLYDAPGWQVVVCPANWQIGDARDIPLGFLLPPKSKGAQLASHSPVKIWAPRAVALALVLGAMIGGYSYYQSIVEAERLALEQAEANRLAAELDALQVPPWQGMPGIDEFASACAALINTVLVNPPGWTLDPVECVAAPGQASVSAKWVRQPDSRAVWFYGTMREYGLESAQLDPTLVNGTFSRSASLPEKDWGDNVEPLDPALMVSRLAHRFDTLSLPITLTAQTAEPSPQSAGAPNRKIWNYHLLELQSSPFLDSQLALLGDVPAVVPESITYDPAQRIWKLKARIYHPVIIQTS